MYGERPNIRDDNLAVPVSSEGWKKVLCGDLCPACHMTCERANGHEVPELGSRWHEHEFDFTSLGQSGMTKHVYVTHRWEVPK